MDPCRIRSYLQVACAGLGFEIGEIWWTGNEHGSSTVATIEEKPTNSDGSADGDGERKLRFVQLYTSKSFENRRSMLVNPPEDDDDDNNSSFSGSKSSMSLTTTTTHDHAHQHGHEGDNKLCTQDHKHDHSCSKQDLEKHKLSPRLVDAISNTAQVVWANTLKQEGLTGRSDIPLHTAVGMPVALDRDGNMCIVVMFSPNNIQSSDGAMEFLQSISRSATSTSIPMLMPAFENTDQLQHVPMSRNNAIKGHIMPQKETSLGEGVTARFVSIDDDENNEDDARSSAGTKGHDLTSAPKDCFGIPMLPSFSDPNASGMSAQQNDDQGDGRSSPSFEDVFDEASYGVWSTIMRDENTPTQNQSTTADSEGAITTRPRLNSEISPELINAIVDSGSGIPTGVNEGVYVPPNAATDSISLVSTHKLTLDTRRKDQLEEFCTAFLGMSVFDIADVWIPAGPAHPGCLSHVTTVTSSNQSNAITDFKRVSGFTLIEFWSGAVGRAFSSGSPVWSCNPDVYIDKGRSQAFERANIMTAFAVPITTSKQASPVGVVCCYSMIQSGSVPFVLKFVQQALHLLWSGLDNVQPHQSVGQEMWQDVGPADLGEMAADVEMQRHFIKKKRPHNSIMDQDPHTAPLSAQLQQAQLSSDSLSFSQQEEAKGYAPPTYNFHYQQQLHPSQQTSVQAMQAFQNHINDAVRQVGEAMPFSHAHIATTSDGSKRAKPKPRPTPAPLSMPHALPSRIVKSVDYRHEYGGSTETHHAPPSNQPKPLGPITTQIAGSPMSAPVSTQHAQPGPVYANHPQGSAGAPIQPQPYQPHHFTQHSQGQNFAQAPAPAPSKLSQNLLSQGMLQSIASHQYQFSNKSGAAPQHHENTMPQTYGVAALPPQNPAGYCAPANAGFPAPDLPQSASTALSAAGNGKTKCCRIQGCDEPSVLRRPYCTRHSGNRLCEHNGCSKCAQGSTRFCIAHGGGRRCTFEGCDKGARDKFFCAAHGGGKRCKADGCNKSAVGGSSLCTAHGGGRRCAIDGCDKSAQSSTKYCVKHGGGKKCCQEGCEKVARGRTQYCAAHGGGVRCKLNGCNRVAIGKMQLCRAHGGGSRVSSKASANSSPPSIPANPTPMFTDTEMDQGMPTSAMDYPTMEFQTAASV